MEQDVLSKKLCGKDFRGQNLSGFNFQYADIRGTNFAEANLENANFKGAKAGLNPFWLIVLVFASFILNGLLVIFFELAGQFVADRIIPVNYTGESPNNTLSNYLVPVVILSLFVIFFIFSISKGLEKAFKTTIIVGVIEISTILLVALILAVIGDFSIGDVAFLITGSINGAIIGFGTGLLAIAVAVILCIDRIISGSTIKNAVTLFAFFITIPVIVFLYHSKAHLITIIIGCSFAWFGVILGWITTNLAFSKNDKYALILNVAISLAAIGGTSFRGANLSEANFHEAILKCTDFRSTDKRRTNLTRTSWLKTKELDFALVGDSYLQYPQVRQLVVERYGKEVQKLDGLNLDGINLQKANLIDASFIGTSLNYANLQDTDLSNAKLKQAQLDGADFTGATLTGAYIEDWNITGETDFDGVRCEYVYMHLPTQEDPDPWRKPDNRNEVFADDEFGDFIKPLVDTLDLYHTQGVDPRAIAIAFKQLAENNPDAEVRIVGMEVKGEDKFLLRAKAVKNIDKSKLSAEYFTIYNELKALAEQEIQALMLEKNDRIQSLQNMITTALQKPEFYTEKGDIIVTNRNINTEGGNYNESIKGSYIEGNYYAAGQQNLAQASGEIQQLLKQLEQSYPSTTTSEQMVVAAEAIKCIESNPSLKKRAINAAKEGGLAAFEKAIDNPAGAFIVGAIKGWQEVETE
jgi:uncharacterized protein YjbI with pentapeptide repeats